MSSLLARARTDIEISKLLLTDVGNPTHDEMFTDQAAYHAEQAIEKALKYQSEMMGIPYKKNHFITNLLPPLEEAGFHVSDELKMNLNSIIDWEVSSRYGDDFSVVKADIEKAIDLYEDLEADILQYMEKRSE